MHVCERAVVCVCAGVVFVKRCEMHTHTHAHTHAHAHAHTHDLQKPQRSEQHAGGHARWRVMSITTGGRHSMCLAMPVRDGQGSQTEDGASEASDR